jgi:hypothetical protein
MRASHARSETVRPALVMISVLALAFASCTKIPTPEDANNAVLSLRNWGSWAWALGVGLIWADLVLPIPQTAVIAALGIIYGSLLGGLLGSLGLITSGLAGYLLMLTSARRFVQRVVGRQSLRKMESLFERGGALAIVVTRGMMLIFSLVHRLRADEYGRSTRHHARRLRETITQDSLHARQWYSDTPGIPPVRSRSNEAQRGHRSAESPARRPLRLCARRSALLRRSRFGRIGLFVIGDDCVCSRGAAYGKRKMRVKHAIDCCGVVWSTGRPVI